MELAEKKPDAKKGLRFNKGKDPWHLVAWDAVQYVVKIYANGTKKYPDRNWEKGLSYDETFSSMMRHFMAFYLGKNRDKESRLFHLAHGVWNGLALLAFELRGMSKFDDIPFRRKLKKAKRLRRRVRR